MGEALAIRILKRQIQVADEEVLAWKTTHREEAFAAALELVIRTSTLLPTALAEAWVSVEQRSRETPTNPTADLGIELRESCDSLLGYLDELRSLVQAAEVDGFQVRNRADLEATFERVCGIRDRIALTWPEPEDDDDPELAAARQLARDHLPNDKLLELARKYPPPQSWYDEPGRPVTPEL